MSSSTRTSSKGGKIKPEKTLKTDKIDTGKSSGDKHVNKESSKSDENLKNKVQQLIETTQRSEEEVCLALHECNNDIDRAANMLYESMTEGQWSVKKKKTRQPSSKQDKQATEESPAGEEWNENQTAEQKDNKPRSKSGGPGHRRYNGDGRGGDGGGRGWRGREKQENERNLDPEGGNRGGEFGRERRGRPGGSGGGRGGGRGGRGGGRGGRYLPRGGNRNNSYNKPIDTWDNNSNTWDNSTAVIPNTGTEETFDDFPGTDEWSTEEYTGSLADTKVFTPSAAQIQLEAQLENQHDGPLDAASQQLTQTLQINQQQPGSLPPQSPVPQKVGALNAAQTKYLNQLTQQNTDKYGSMQTFQAPAYEAQQYIAGGSQGYNAPQSYGGQPSNSYVNSSYPVTSNYGTTPESVPSQQPTRTKTQRARVPPPSKIPASAVEMPGDLNSSIGYLDVQFGAMDFMSDGGSFEGVVDPSKYVASTNNAAMENVAPAQNAANLDLSNQGQNANLDAYSAKNSAQSSITSALTQSLPNVENIPTSEHVSGTGSYSVSSRTAAANAASQSSTPQAVLDMSKPESHSYSQNTTYNSYQSKNYNSTYNGSQTTASSYQPANSYVNSQPGSYNNATSGNSYQNSYSSATSYQSNSNSAAFPSITQANSYAGTNQSYSQNANQSVYGANAGLNNSSTYGNTASTAQYNNYSSATNKLKETVYDGTGSGGNSQATTASSIASSSTAPLTHSQTTVSSTKTTTTLAAKNSNNVVTNLPPGVTGPVMSTPYNMVQLPYFQQPLYSYEDVQILQQRLPPHMSEFVPMQTTPFYDMSYQTPTTLAAVRDAALGNVGYSISSDGRFARGDNNASPVPSTLGQQTSTQAGHQAAQPMLAGAAAAPYFFTTHFNTIPNYPFYLPAATNAHGTNSSSQYPKPGGYSSGYGAYDALSQTQEYSKGTYVGNAQGQKGTGGAVSTTGSTGNELPIYGKSHNALGKVNSYEKQGFHSGTPPPFTGTMHGSQSAGLAPSGTGYVPPVYIPAMAPQHHSTQLMHQPLHQESGNNSGQRSQSSNQAKVSGKQYPGSYWNQS